MWSFHKVIAIVLLSALSKGDLPEDEFRIINRKDLLAVDADSFEDNSTRAFSQLLFDVARDQIIVGARDALFRLTLHKLRPLERTLWVSPADTVKLCQDKGQTEEDCHNYIKVLLSYGHKLLACGTNAYNPQCSWREIESIRNVTGFTEGKANCPFNPHSNVTALIASSGEYYAGTPMDFTSSFYGIYRSRGASEHAITALRTPQYDLKWLNEPQFVGSFEDDQYVYFVFREIAVEHLNCGKIIYSRIARVCKNDPGGHPMMKDNWSTLVKARLSCAIHGDIPFNYDEIQSMEYLPQEKLIVAAFTAPVNSIDGSAICVYNMTDVQLSFEGPFKVQDSPTSTWESRSPPTHVRRHYSCKADSGSQQPIEYNKYNLMHESIQPISGEPVYKAVLQRFTHITVDVASAKNVGKQLVLFVATQDSDVLKLTVLPRHNGACLVEKWRLKDEKMTIDVQSIQFVKDTMSVYIGTNTGVYRIGSERCSRYASRSSCVGAVDPHCGWDDARELCVSANLHFHDPYFVQNTLQCPSGTLTATTRVEGGWSTWSEWEPCMQEGTSKTSYSDDKPDMCMCRTRSCNNPPPANGGTPCKGASISVRNCTVHGGWSSWSGWSECSAPCGIAVKSRRRTCSSPEPQFGGRVCVGLDVHDVYCTHLPPCPDPSLAPVDGGWSEWGTWSTCEGGCGVGGGSKQRRRTCTDPPPGHGGSPCQGNEMERQVCDMKPCEVRKATAWTPWVQLAGNSTDGSYTEKRFKFSCRAPSSEQLKISIAREEERYCTSEGDCSSTPIFLDNSGWDPWGPWGECSALCGGGQQARTRRCRRPPCEGPSSLLRACNSQACSGEWSCWTDWGPCTGQCGNIGRRSRSRRCLSPDGCDAGAALQTRACLVPCAETESGWGPWGEWSTCMDGERVRRRVCIAGACQGAQLQASECGDDLTEFNEIHAMPAYTDDIERASLVRIVNEANLSVGGIVGCVIAAFIIGYLVCLAVVIYCSRNHRLPWRRKTKVPSSPHYITAKQNSYVTVPLKDVPRKAKRQPSFTGIGGSSGIILSKSNNLSNANNHNNGINTPKLYPKAIANEYDSMGTLKRHSTQPNNKNNLDLEEDKFF